MKTETKSWLMGFLAAFLATILGIVLTFGIQSYMNSKKREETAKLLAIQITENMEGVNQQINSYLEIYNAIDTTYKCVHRAIQADTLEKVKSEITDTLLGYSLAEYAQLEAENILDAYKLEILNTIGDVDLIEHIDNFYILAQQYVNTSSLVIEQKQKVIDLTNSKFDIWDHKAKREDILKFLDSLPEFKVFYCRMVEVRAILIEIEKQMKVELDECKKILKIEGKNEE